MQQSTFFARSQDFEPVKLQVRVEDFVTYSAYGFMNSEAAIAMSKLCNGSGSLSADVSFITSGDTLMLDDEQQVETEGLPIDNDALNMPIRQSAYPQLLTVLGEMQEVGVELLERATVDPRLYPKILEQVPKLFSSAVVYTGFAGLLILSCESYGRFSETDIHMESNGESIPPPFLKLRTLYIRQQLRLLCAIFQQEMVMEWVWVMMVDWCHDFFNFAPKPVYLVAIWCQEMKYHNLKCKSSSPKP